MKVLAFPGPKQRLPDERVEEAVAPPEPAFAGEAPPPKYDRITIRAITVALALSLFLHIVILVGPWFNELDKQMKAPADEIGPLSVTIADTTPPPGPQPKPESPPVEKSVPTPTPTPTPPRQVARPAPAPPHPRPQIAVTRGSRPPFVVPPPTAAPPPLPAPAPVAPPQPQPQPVQPSNEDFSDVLAARQRARRAANGGAPDEVVESDNERANRIAKANILAQQRSSSPGQDPDQSGGIFDLRHTGLNDAEFVFNGWNRNFQRKLGQVIEVRTGNAPDIRIAVVRRMIDIIREQKPGDFEWYNYRTGKTAVMSARPKDQPELELFLLKEFYPDDPRINPRARVP